MLTQGSLYVQEWKNGVAEYVDFSDIHITCKYGWKSMDNGTTQVGTLTDVSLAEWSTHDFITIPGDSHTVEASWDDEQHMMESPVLYDIVFTVNNQKINKMSWNPTNNGWTTIGDCATVDTGINNGYQVEFLNYQRDIHVETQTDTKAWSTTEPYFGTGVIADGAYSNGNIYLIADGTNHPGELSINETATWNSSDILKYSKQTSGIMFYAWDPANVTQCLSLNHYTWDVSNVYLGYDNTTALVIGGVTYTKTGTTYTLHYGGSLGQGGACYSTDGITWSTPLISANATFNEGTTVYIKGVPETGYQFQKWSDDNTDNPRQLTMNSNLSYTALFVAAPQPPVEPDLTGRYYFNSQDEIVFYFNSSSSIELGLCGDTNTYYYEWLYTDHWTVRVDLGGDHYDLDYYENNDVFENNGAVFTYSSTNPCGGSTPYSVDIITSGQGTVDGIHSGDQTGQYYLTAIPSQGWVFDHWTISGWDTQDNPLDTSFPDTHQTVYVYFVQEGPGPQPETYTVTVNVTGQGTTTGAGDYEEGEQVTLTAAPSTGYEFSSWQINGTVVETNSTYQFIMGNQDVTITAVFEEEAEKHIYLCDNSGAHLAEMTKTGSTWSVTGAFTSGMYSIRATVENEYNDAWFKFYQTSGDNRVFIGAGDDPDFEEIGTYIVVDNILTSFSLVEDQTTGYYVVSYENTGAMTTSMVDTIVNSYIGDFVTGSDIAEMGYMTATDISSMSYVDSTSLSAMSYVDTTALSNMSYVDTTYLANQDYSTKSYMMSYVSDAISGIQPGGSSTKTVTMSCTGGTEYELDDAIFYIPNTISNVTFVQKWQRTNSTSGTWTIYNFNMGSTAVMRIGLPTDKYVSSLTLTCNGYSDTFNVTTVPTTSSYQDITIYYWGFQHVWQYLNDYDWTMTIVYSNKPQSIDIDWMINSSTLQSLASNKGLTSVEHGSQNISDFTSDVVLTDMKTLDNSGKTNVYLNGVSSSMEDMVNTSCLLFRTSNLNAANPTKSDIESIWETARWNCIEEYGTPATIGDWEVVYYINGSDWCPANTDLMTISGDTTQLQNNFDVYNWTEQPSDQYKYFYYIKTIEIMSME